MPIRAITSASIQRKFDTFFIQFTVYHDNASDESGVRFNFEPLGLNTDVGSDSVTNNFQSSKR